MRPVALRLRALLVEVAAIVATAWATFLALRAEVGERYLVATPSMEPTLHGSPERGDVVLVDKTAFWDGHGDLRRFDLVVVRDDDRPDANLLVKRFVAIGPATLAIARGDLLLADPTTGAFAPIVKHPIEDADLLLTSFATAATDAGGVDPTRFVGVDVARLPGGALAVRGRPGPALFAARAAAAAATPPGSRSGDGLDGHLSTATAIDTGFVGATGASLGAARGFPRDIAVEVDVALDEACVAVHLALESAGEFRAVRIERSGRGRASHDGVPTDPTLVGAVLGDGRIHRLGFGHLDGRLWATVDGELVAWWPAELPARFRGELRLGEADPAPVANRLHVAAEGGTLALHRFVARHDALLRDDADGRHHLESGDVFLLGDNVHDSADSRDRRGDPFHRTDLVGRPVAVLAPAARRRWLRREPSGAARRGRQP